MESTTLLLGALALVAIVYVVGIGRTQAAASRAGSGLRRATSSGVAAGATGAGAGLMFGDQLVTAILTEPGFSLAAVAGIFGALGTGGFLGDVSALQFLLIGLTAFVVVWSVFGGES